METILEQAKQLEDSIRDLEKRKSELQTEVKRLDQECEKKRLELQEHTERYSELNAFLPAGDDVLSLDAGGEVFRVYRSTLQQVEGSVLCTLASGRWQGTSDGRIFLDCNPLAFQEILDFLRRRRLDPSELPAFRARTAKLADYLGIPVARVVEENYFMADFQRAGDNKVAPGFMFDVSISGPWQCLLHAISFSMGRGGKATLFVRRGSCLEGQGSEETWQELGSHQVVMGKNRMELARGQAKVLGPNGQLGIYLCFSEGADDLLYSDKPSTSQHKVLSEHCQLSDGMKLSCLKGRVAGAKPFSAGAHGDDRFFVGSMEYSLEP